MRYVRVLLPSLYPSVQLQLEGAEPMVRRDGHHRKRFDRRNFISSNIKSKLLEELVGVWPDRDARVKYEVVEGVPYLVSRPSGSLSELMRGQTAVIKESLHLSLGVTESLPRVVNQDMVINGVDIPAGVSFPFSLLTHSFRLMNVKRRLKSE